MVMDQSLSGFYGSNNNGLDLSGDCISDFSNENNGSNGFGTNVKVVDQNYSTVLLLPPDPTPSNFAPSSCVNQEDYAHEDFDFSDVVLKYINQMLMEEDMEEKTCMFQESAALQAAEQSFYKLIGEKYRSAIESPTPCTDLNHESPDGSDALQDSSSCSYSTSIASSTNLVDPGWHSDPGEYKSWQVVSRCTSQSSFTSSNGTSGIVDAFADSPLSTLKVPEMFNEMDSVMQFKRGFEEASKFLPNGNSLSVDLESKSLYSKEFKESKDVVVEEEKKYRTEYLLDGSRVKKNPLSDDDTMEGGRSNKQPAVCSESKVSSEMFDMILLNCGKNDSATLREAMQNGTSKNLQQNGQSKGMNGGKARGKKQGRKRDVVDLRTLLTLCAQSIAADDRRSAEEFLKQIRQHSSPTGDGMQRMAHYFADGLEARMAGSGTQIYKALITKPTSAAHVLKAYHLFLAACPFKKLSNFFSNKTIMNLAEKATRLHIIDFGILYGFQWPCLIQRLSSRPGGPPNLRITGVDFPQPGFRPAERVEETGRRLANYAETFKVSFEFKAIAQKWDTIRIEDLKLDRDEVLVVNCMHRFRNLLDETVLVESPRNIVLNLIRKMNPDVFILGTVNGAYTAPFFITRFREALYHFSTLFDMLETNVLREIPERMLIEREIFGREAMNVIACEGSERIERPETYKQWQVRILRAGFRQLPLNQEIIQRAKERVKSYYHKDFVIDKDGQWLLKGWKGRIAFALSSWTPAC
ncbi:GRAS transcription factor [Trema orientale]|uniref:GRAS transcription factor n=1 Tax=Trema orientale TaxID=63057 RepID=A0A2P5CIW2_TREOI|nr:GRAS transcription factor [Trema orientale]